jgi:hypothetical protein
MHVSIPSVVAEQGNRAKNWTRRLLGRDPLPAYDGRFCFQFYSSAKAQSELGYSPRPFDAIAAEGIAHLQGRSRVDEREPSGTVDDVRVITPGL